MQMSASQEPSSLSDVTTADRSGGPCSPPAESLPPVDFLFTGAVDHGKSTIAGHLLRQVGAVAEHEFSNISRMANAAGMASWKFAYIVDTDESERERGKTHEYSVTPFRHGGRDYRMFDTPGHKIFIRQYIQCVRPHMVAALVVSMQENEYSSSFERGTLKEQALILRCLGITRLVLVLNKMDVKGDAEGGWDQAAADERTAGLRRYLRRLAFSSVVTCYVSGLTGEGLTKPKIEGTPSLIDALRSLWVAGGEAREGSASAAQSPPSAATSESLLLECVFFEIPTVITAGYQLIVHAAEHEREAVIEKMDCRLLRPTDIAQKHKMRLALSQPLSVESGQRVLLRYSEGTLGYGKVMASVQKEPAK